MQQKCVWIMNHYATNMFFNKGGRHYWFAEILNSRGHKTAIFCANTRHNSNDVVPINSGKFITKDLDGIPFVFVKTPSYNGNGYKRVINMLVFFKNLFNVSKKYAESTEKPDVIIASSVHPLTLVAGIQIAKRFGVPCICEVRDLWPESIVAYGLLKRKSLIAKLLYQGEKWIYKKADSIIMTWEGGKDYIIDQGWTPKIDIEKVKHISNGVVIESFDRNSEKYKVKDDDLMDSTFKNVIYAGSIGKVNNIGLLLESAKIIEKQGISDIRFLVYGDGDEYKALKKRCIEENLTNVIFKGRVEKIYVPYILKNAYVNILHNTSTSLDKYGQSQNKFFEYLAAGKCIVQTYSPGYSICERKNCGITVSIQTPQEIAKAVIKVCSDDTKCRMMGDNARNAAFEFDFNNLTDKLIEIVNELRDETQNIPI